MNHLTSNITLQTSNYLYTHIKISQRIIQTCFQIRTWFTLTNDQCTTNTIFTSRKFFCIAPGITTLLAGTLPFISTGSLPLTSMIFVDWVNTTLAPKHSFFFNPHPFHHNTTAANKTTIFNNHRDSLQRFQHTTNTNTTT